MPDDAGLADFFARYAERSLGESPEAIAAAYAPSFFMAGPKGSGVFQNDAAFLEWLRGVHAFNEKTGLRALRALSVDGEVLSPTHALARVRWASRYAKTGEREITFDITYVMERTADSWRILGSISHEDQDEVMRTFGLT